MAQANAPKWTILIVDDQPENLFVLTEILTRQGYLVRPAISGQVALRSVRKDPPDVILLDIMMPGLDGYAVCQELKRDPELRDIPVIFISALNDTVDKIKAFQAGGVDYVTKPFQVAEVAARVETHVKLRDMQRQLQLQNLHLQKEIQERQQAEETLQHRHRELELLNRLSHRFSSSLELPDVLATVLAEIQRLLDAVALSFWLLTPAKDALICKQAKGPGSANLVDWRLALGQGITGWAAQCGESVVVPDTWADARHLRDVDEQTGVAVRSMLSIPLRVKGAVIGVLNLADPRIGHFTPNDLIFLEPLAAAAATAIENAQLYATAQQEIAERKRAEQVQASLYRISEAAQTAQHLDDLFPAIRNILSGLLPTDNFYIAFYDGAAEMFSFPYSIEANLPVKRAPRKLGSGLAEYVLRTGQPLLFTPEVRAELVKRGEMKPVAFEPTVVDWLGVPLKADQKITGVLVVKSYAKEVRLQESEKQILMFVSTQIALALERKRAEDLVCELEKAVETTEVGITITDPAGRIVYINPADAQMHGYAAADLFGQPANLFSLPESRERKAEPNQPLEAAPNWKRERLNLRKDGTVFPAMLISNPIYDDQGARIGTVTVCEDITERKQAEQLLQESEKRYRSIFENAPTGIFQVTREGRLLAANPALGRMLGYPAVRELLAQVTNIAEQVYVEPRHWYEMTELLRESAEVAEVESRCRYRDGGELIINLHVWAVPDARGQTRYFEGFMADITERKQMEAALVSERNLLRTLIDSSPECIYVKDPESRFLLANKAMFRLLKLTAPDELTGKTDFDFYPDYLAEQIYDAERPVITAGEPLINREEMNIDRDTGELRWFLTSKVPFHDSEGNIAGLVGLNRDITELKKTEDTLRKQAILLRGVAGAMNRLLVSGDLAASMTETLEVLGFATGVDRISIFETCQAAETGAPLMSHRFTWAQDLFEVACNLPELQNRPYHPGLARWYELLQANQVVSGLVRELPPAERAWLEPHGSVSTLVVPITIRQGFWGFIGFDNCQTERQWSEEEESILLAMAGSIGGAIARQQAETKLIAANSELTKTLDDLQRTQVQLVQSEKMAALGQLIAGVAHEINTPLGAIRSAVVTIARILNETLAELPAFFESLAPERRADFFALLHQALRKNTVVNTKEERGYRRALTEVLNAQQVANARRIADKLVDMGVYDRIEPFFPMFQDPAAARILTMAYELAGLHESTRTISTGVDRASKVVFALKTYARYDHSGEMVQANVVDGLETVLTLYQNQLKHGVEVSRQYAELPLLFCYPDELNQVWTNLIHNALQAMAGKGRLEITVSPTPIPSQEGKNEIPLLGGDRGGWVLIEITDSGGGIPDSVKQRIFEPFFTTKAAGEGSGLGLDICRKIIDKHQGKIDFESQPGRTTFSVWLPVRKEP